MSLDKKRVWLALLIILGVIIAAAVAGWFLIVPGIIESKVNSALLEVSDKIGRQVKIENVRLSGLTSAKVDHLTISDHDDHSRVGVRVNDIEIALRDIPLNGEFSLSSVQVGELEVMLRRENGKTNFDDILDKLKSQKDDGDEGPKDPPAWKRYLTPFPEIGIETLSLTTTPVKIRDDLEIGAVSVSDLKISATRDATPVYQMTGQLSTLLIESGTPVTYETTVAGNLISGKEGTVSLSFPRTKDGKALSMLTQDGVNIEFDDAQFVLPTTFAIHGLSVTKDETSLIHADQVRARLMQLPPAKVSGVYFKEVELNAPEIHDILTDNGSALLDTFKTLEKQWLPPQDGHIVVAPVKANSSPKDHFFSQRFFITDGVVEIDDKRTRPLPPFAIKDMNVEIGYRSIRKVLDYQISLQTELPFTSTIGFEGKYEMGTDATSGRFDIKALHGTDAYNQYQSMLASRFPKESSTQLKTAAALGLLHTLNLVDDNELTALIKAYAAPHRIPRLDFSSAYLNGFVDFDIKLNEEKFSLNTSLDCTGLKLDMKSMSPDPVDLSGGISLQADIDLRKHDYLFKDITLKTPNGAHLVSSAHFTEVDRKVKDRGPKFIPEYVKSWQFEVQVDLPKQEMQTLFEAIPSSLRNEMEGIRWTGTLGSQFSATGYLDKLSETQHKFTLDVSPDFGISHWPVDRNLNALNTGMTHAVVDPNALQPHSIAIPPSVYPIVIQNIPVYTPRYDADGIRSMYPDWVLFDDLNPWLIQLVTTTEDGNFFNHAGFSPLQIKVALEKNVSNNAFSRGASTISMQLIKNLFFDRTKTISRKFQEMLYTWMMESILHIPKQRIMELYFNIIEFGPEIYGIEEASKYYFGKRSADLSLKESAFLMAIIPSPRKGAIHRGKPQLDKWIQKTINFYIQEMYRRKCNPDTLSKMRARYARMGQEMPFEPCCPPQDSIQLMLDSDTLSFYIPNPQNPAEYGYRPDLYTENGLLLNPAMRKRSCGIHSSVDPELESIFETLSADQLPSKAEIFE